MAASWRRGDYPLPDFLSQAPQLMPHLGLYLNSFWDLCSDRGGMGDGRIRWTAAKMWADAHQLDQEGFSNLWYYLRELDTVFLASQK